MFQVGIKCENCPEVVTLSVNTFIETESGNHLPARRNICANCLMDLYIDLHHDGSFERKPTKPQLIRIK